MALAVNVSSSWKYVQQAYTNINNSWKAIRHIYINSNGTWKPLYSYSWWTGDWGACSVSCGGGTQTRNVVCVRNHPGQTGHVGDWKDVADTFCIASGLAKPPTSQSCNTHSCTECRYTVSTGADNYGTCYPATDPDYLITNAWSTSKGTGFYDYEEGSITWDRTSMGSVGFTATSATLNGYYYTRQGQRESCGNINTSIPGSTQYTNYYFYEVCRTPV